MSGAINTWSSSFPSIPKWMPQFGMTVPCQNPFPFWVTWNRAVLYHTFIVWGLVLTSAVMCSDEEFFLPTRSDGSLFRLSHAVSGKRRTFVLSTLLVLRMWALSSLRLKVLRIASSLPSANPWLQMVGWHLQQSPRKSWLPQQLNPIDVSRRDKILVTIPQAMACAASWKRSPTGAL